MRHSKRLNFLRAIFTLVAVFTTSAFVINIFDDVGNNELHTGWSAKGGGNGGGEREAKSEKVDRGWNEFNASSYFERNCSLEKKLLFDELNLLKGHVEDLHEQLKRLEQNNTFLLQHLIRLRHNSTILSRQYDPLPVKDHVISINHQSSEQNDHGGFRSESIFSDENVRQKLLTSEVLDGGQVLKSEYELVPFARFTSSRIYLVEPGLEKRVIEKPIGFKRQSLEGAVEAAVQWLNRNRNLSTSSQIFQPKDNESNTSTDRLQFSNQTATKFYKSSDFLEGIYRTVPGLSEHYETYFRDLDTPKTYRKVVLARVFSPPLVISSQVKEVLNEFIHIVMPLQGRQTAFEQFIYRFEEVCVNAKENVYLTIVCFGGGEELETFSSIVNSLRSRSGFQNVRLLVLGGEFSRGRALMVGATKAIPGVDAKNTLLFFCDVDVIFTSDFLQRCRLNAEQGKRVYYPILFSLYNPNIVNFLNNREFNDKVYSRSSEQLPNNETVKSQESDMNSHNTIIISVDTGFWRDFGYGMTCQYSSDFLASGGFDMKHRGWGMEDVFLYRKYVKSRHMVVRATDPAIFHVWHDKICSQYLAPAQYRSCIRSKALNEASHAQLGMLIFKDEIEQNLKAQTQRAAFGAV